jgi:subtilisin family serine protease
VIPLLPIYNIELKGFRHTSNQDFISNQLFTPIIPRNSINNIHLSTSFNAGDYIGLSQNVWNKTLTGTNVTIAIIDTGIYANHSVITNDGKLNWSDRIIKFYNVIDNITTLPEDDHGHGTWVASILGGNNSIYQGVAPNVSYIILKIFDNNGETNSSILLKAVDWILYNGDNYNIRIVSMSFGAKPESDNLYEISRIQDTVEKLVDKGILVVAAAGNDGDPTKSYGDGTINSPASGKKILAVGGVNFFGSMYPYSSKGPTFEGIIKPDVCAPAVGIFGADKDYTNDYSYRSGTSGATPFVAGLAALMLEKYPELNPLQLKNIISLTSFKTLNPLIIKDNIQGWGIIQGYAALDALKPPVMLNDSSNILVNLNQNKTVFCLPIKLNSNHYFFEMEQLNDTSAEMYVFSKNPDIYGEPILLSHTINPIIGNVDEKRMGLLVDQIQDFYLLVKLTQKATGQFMIRFVFEYRIIFFIAFGVINIISLVYIVILMKNFKKRYNKS